jgi:hypothetical protein
MRPGAFTLQPIQPPRDLREAFLEIKRMFLHEQQTRHTLEEMTYCYSNLFRSYNLSDLQFRLQFNDKRDCIEFIPLRIIDKLAIEGILSMPQLLTREILFEKTKSF